MTDQLLIKSLEMIDQERGSGGKQVTDQIQEEGKGSIQEQNRQNDSAKGLWTYVQQIKLFKLHDQLGNKWALIAKQFQNRTDNSIKNHLYSKLRKALRKLNKFITLQFKKQLKDIKVIVLYKIIEATQQRHKPNPSCNQQTSDLCIQLKNRLLMYSCDQDLKNDHVRYPNVTHQLINDLVNFSKQYKRKTKKVKNNSIRDCELLSPNCSFKAKRQSSQNEQSQGSSAIPSDYSVIGSQASQVNPAEQQKNLRNIFTRGRAKSKQQIYIRKEGQKQFNDNFQNMQEESEVQNIFKASTILLQDDFQANFPCITKRHNSSYFNQSQSINQEEYNFHFFQESQIQMRIFPAKTQDHFDDPLLNQKNFNIFD